MRYEVFSDTVCPILNLCSVGYAKDPAVTRFGAGVRNLYIVHYVLAGKGYFNGNAVNAGQGFLITPNMREHYFPDEKSPWEFLWFISNDENSTDTAIRTIAYPIIYIIHSTKRLFTSFLDIFFISTSPL